MSDDDCIGCRLVSGEKIYKCCVIYTELCILGGGLICAALYIQCQAANKSKGNRIAMYAVASVFGALGIARLSNIYPFNHQNTKK